MRIMAKQEIDSIEFSAFCYKDNTHHQNNVQIHINIFVLLPFDV